MHKDLGHVAQLFHIKRLVLLNIDKNTGNMYIVGDTTSFVVLLSKLQVFSLISFT